MSASLDALLQHPALWRANGAGRVQRLVVPTGYAALDAHLPGGGWPCPALIEVLHEPRGLGELSLFLPALRRLSAALTGQPARAIACFNPPHVPYAPAFAGQGLDPTRLLISRPLNPTQTLWAMEQALRSGACAAVLAWAGNAPLQSLRRLKLAASSGAALGVLFRPTRCRSRLSPATLRLALSVAHDALVVELVKVQGGRTAIAKLPRLAA